MTSSKPEIAIYPEQEPADLAGFFGDLVVGAKDVGIVLRKRANAHEAVQRTRGLVAVYFAELRELEGKVAVAAQIALEHLHVTRAVHGLDCEHMLVGRFRREHVLAERVPVPRRLPEATVHELGRVDLVIAGLLLALAHEVDESLEQCPASRMPEHGTDGFVLEME